MKKIVVLTGAGISAESGLKTFRDDNGLWEGHDVLQVASIEGWQKNKALVLDFYNQRRRQLFQVTPNAAHYFLKELEENYEVVIITQNIDDLHERAGSSNVFHLHGELLKARSSSNPNLICNWEQDIEIGDTSEDGSQLRPHIVWFGEEVPLMKTAYKYCLDADILLVIGTSMQVYPAASLIQFVSPETKIYFIDPKPNISNTTKNLILVSKKATEAVEDLKRYLL
ncbi:SIR2 family NAD-dependent protein deacylase [Namhaeicola litoreus]|uniref:NAD-dependent protein deacylase n=1 Tax=Namhaeicola litoreus TaxID=1052145 RepID=A0ABW3Y6X0_9FLAO